MEKTKTVLELKSEKVKGFFLKGNRYCSEKLPKYFSFDKILQKVDKKLKDNNLSDFLKPNNKPENLDDVNYKLFNNKDGQYAWRLLELIHPVIYVSLVHKIVKNWETITDRFNKFKRIKNIECTSIPIVENNEKKNEKAAQILNWWHSVEQESIKLSLDYCYVFHTDIVDCYGAIYTHSIPWALHGIDEAKKNRDNNNSIGNIIDHHIRMMRYGQTNGIPQGSVLMDFIAEMVLGYVDELLNEKIQNIKDYKILRYRDDYRIFSNSVTDGQKILKALSEVLSSLGMRLGAEKTLYFDDIVENAVKKDKLFAMRYINKNQSIVKQLLIIKEIANKYPNSGSLIQPLTKVSKQITKKDAIRNEEVLLALVVDLMYRNPRIYDVCSQIISVLLSFFKDDKTKKDYLGKIKEKFEKLPNTEILNIWLQRISYKIDETIEYKGELCNKVKNKNGRIWNNKWLNKPENFICNIVDKDELERMPEVMQFDETKIFDDFYKSS